MITIEQTRLYLRKNGQIVIRLMGRTETGLFAVGMSEALDMKDIPAAVEEMLKGMEKAEANKLTVGEMPF